MADIDLWTPILKQDLVMQFLNFASQMHYKIVYITLKCTKKNKNKTERKGIAIMSLSLSFANRCRSSCR